MPFTDHSDLFAAVDEDGLNLIVKHLMRQRPSMFNYGTARVKQQPQLLCSPITPAPAVLARGNPLITVEDPLPVVGTRGSYGIDFCLQLTRAEIDFHPRDVIALPPELQPAMTAQRFALSATACAGIGCPSPETVDQLPPVAEDAPPPSTPAVIPSAALTCFCLELAAVGHAYLAGPPGLPHLVGKLDGLEIVDLKPEGLEATLECYLRLLIQLVVLPRVAVTLKKVFSPPLNLPAITLIATPTSPQLPNNPAIETDLLKAFANLEVS
jgi:hypothetical protein